MKRFSIAFTISMLFLLIGMGMAPYSNSFAPLVTFVVDVPFDNNDASYQACTPAPNDCSLRGAISASNASYSTVDQISIPAGIYALTIPGTGEDSNVTGDLDIWTPVTIQGAGRYDTFIQAGSTGDTGIDRVLHIYNWDGAVTITDLTLRWGKLTSYPGGAGIYQDGDNSTVVLERVVVSGNQVTNTAPGAGVLAEGDMTLRDVILLENYTNGTGGGISTSLNSYLYMERCSIDLNRADWGGGIHMEDAAVLRNVTFYRNMAYSTGAGISQLGDDSILTMNNSTVYHNSIEPGSKTTGWAIAIDGTATINNSILSAEGGNYPCENSGTINGSSNISTNTGCGASFIVTDPMLGPTRGTIGYTSTPGLLAGSPAIDGGDDFYCLDEDQRGVPRPIDGDLDGTAACDIGAYELENIFSFLPLIKSINILN